MANLSTFSLVLLLKLAGRRGDIIASVALPESRSGLTGTLLSVVATGIFGDECDEDEDEERLDDSLVLLSLRLLASLTNPNVEKGAGEEAATTAAAVAGAVRAHLLASKCLGAVAPYRAHPDPDFRNCVEVIATNLLRFRSQ